MLYCSACGAANTLDSTTCFACEQPLYAAKDEDSMPQTLLHTRYQLLTSVGTGGFGEVYKAIDIQTSSRFVAIKQINLKGLSPQEMIDATETFNREVELLTQLTHPNLPHVYEHFTDPNHWYLIMDFIEGQTLEQYLQLCGDSLPVDEVLEVGVQLCSVLHYLHTRQPPIIFRDVKPANIMLTPGKQVYLIDFGAARLFKPGRLRDTIAFGSPGYAAPEQYGKAQTTARSDIYSLGATLHHLLTGHDPSESPFHFASLSSAKSGMPPDLNTLLMSMVNLDVNQRPQSAIRVKQHLQTIATEHGQRLYAHSFGSASKASSAASVVNLPPAPPPPADWSVHAPTLQQAQLQLGLPPSPTSAPVPQTPKPKRKVISRRSVIAGAASVTLALGLFGSDLLIFAPHPKPAVVSSAPDTGQQVTPPTPNFSIQGNAVTYHAGSSIYAMDWLPALDMLDQVAVATTNDNIYLFDGDAYRNLPLFSSMPPDPIANVVKAIAWSHAGLSFATQEPALAAGDVTGTVHVYTLWSRSDSTFHQRTVNALRWSPDNAYLASASEDGTVVVSRYVVNETSIGLTTVSTYSGHVGVGPVYAVSWSPDGKQIASVGLDGKVHVWDAMTGKAIQQYPANAGTLYTVEFSPRENTQIAFAGANGVVSVWNSQSGKIITQYHGHHGPVATLAWSSDAQSIISGGSGNTDYTVQVWNPVNGENLAVYNEHTAPVTGVAWTHNTNPLRIASSSEDGTIVIRPSSYI